MSKQDDRLDFLALNEEYQKCLNKHYDQIFEGIDVEINDDTCKEYRQKMKRIGDYHENLEKEYIKYSKDEENKSSSN